MLLSGAGSPKEEQALISKNGGEIGLGYNSYRGRPREMHKITCSDCGKEAEVPFKPTEGKPVYCRDCYQKHRQY